MNLPEFIQPFGIAKGAVTKLKASTDRGGYLSLYTVSGGPIFLFRGEVTAAQAEAAIAGGDDRVEFALASNANHPATVRIETGFGICTVFSAAASVGFLRWHC